MDIEFQEMTKKLPPAVVQKSHNVEITGIVAQWIVKRRVLCKTDDTNTKINGKIWFKKIKWWVIKTDIKFGYKNFEFHN